MGRNTSRISDFAIKWLSEPDSPPTSSAGPPDFALQKIPMPERVGKASVEVANLNLGFGLIRASHSFHPEQADKLFNLANFGAKFAEPTLVIHATQNGRVQVKNNVAEKQLIYGGETVTFQLVDRIDFDAALVMNERVDLSGIWIPSSTLAMLLGDGIAHGLLHALQLRQSPTALTWRIPRHISHTLHSSMPSHMTGDMRKLYAQAKVLEYLTLLASYVSDEAKAVLSPRTRKIVQLREELENVAGEFPRLNDLAARYGMSARSLNDSFRQMYGQTIGSFAMHRRLELAHAALRETDVPMKVLAARLGYGHVNHFNAAFARVFGYPPGDLRR